MIDIKLLQSMNELSKIAVTEHARIRLHERGISVRDITSAIGSGQIIKQYEDDKPLPSCLILGTSDDGKQIHIVVSHDDDFIYVITAYFPDVTIWEDDLKTKRRQT